MNVMAGQPTPPKVPPIRNKGLIAGLIKGNQWLFPNLDTKHHPPTPVVYREIALAVSKVNDKKSSPLRQANLTHVLHFWKNLLKPPPRNHDLQVIQSDLLIPQLEVT